MTIDVDTLVGGAIESERDALAAELEHKTFALKAAVRYNDEDKARIAALEAALGWYADNDKYTIDEYIDDCGERARAALGWMGT